MAVSRLCSCILAGCLAYSVGCHTLDPIQEQYVRRSIEEMKKGILPKNNTDILKEDCGKDAFKENLEKLLGGPDWEQSLYLAVDTNFIDEKDIGTAVKKVLRNQNSIVMQEGRIVELLIRCKPSGYDIIKDTEGRELFFDLLKQGRISADQTRYVKTLLESVPDHAKELMSVNIKNLMAKKDYSEAGLMAYQFITAHGALPLSKEEFYILGDCYENGGRKGLPRAFATGDDALKSDLEIAEKLYCEGLLASGNEDANAKLISKIIFCANSQLLLAKQITKDDSLINIKELADYIWKLPIEKETYTADSLLQHIHTVAGENRLEYIVQYGFRPSEKAVREYCEKILANGGSFEDVLFFVAKWSNSIPPEKYLHFAAKMLSRRQLSSKDIFYTASALELAKEYNPHLSFPNELFLCAEKLLADSSLDLTSISRLWSILSQKNYWSEERYKERQNIFAFTNQNSKRTNKNEIAALLLVDITKIAYHTYALNLECSGEWMQEVSNYLSALTPPEQTVFKEELAKTIEAKKYLQFAGDISAEQGRISFAYSLWMTAGFESGAHYLKKKYPDLLN